MHRLILLCFVFAFTAAFQAPAKDAEKSEKASPYFDPATIDFKAILAPPPGKDETQKEIELILQDQAARTPEQVANIKREEHYSVMIFSDVPGSWLLQGDEKSYPLTRKLLARVTASARNVVVKAKNFYQRPRPFAQNSEVHPPIDKPEDFSYPSGHSTHGTLDALVLAELAPDLKEALLARGRRIGDDRVLAGVHFPSDVEAGRSLGRAIFTQLMVNPDFQADLAKAKAEVQAKKK